MPIKIAHFTLPFLLLFSCADREPHQTERWELDSCEGTGVCGLTFDPIESNSIAETFLGLNDSTYMEMELHLSDDETFKIVKNKGIALTGKWHITVDKRLILTSKNESWGLEIITQTADSLVLKAAAYPIMQDVRMTLKR